MGSCGQHQFLKFWAPYLERNRYTNQLTEQTQQLLTVNTE